MAEVTGVIAIARKERPDRIINARHGVVVVLKNRRTVTGTAVKLQACVIRVLSRKICLELIQIIVAVADLTDDSGITYGRTRHYVY